MSDAKLQYKMAYSLVRRQQQSESHHEYDYYEDKIALEVTHEYAELARQSWRMKHYMVVETPKDFWFVTYRKHANLKAYERAAELSDTWLSSFLGSG